MIRLLKLLFILSCLFATKELHAQNKRFGIELSYFQIYELSLQPLEGSEVLDLGFNFNASKSGQLGFSLSANAAYLSGKGKDGLLNETYIVQPRCNVFYKKEENSKLLPSFGLGYAVVRVISEYRIQAVPDLSLYTIEHSGALNLNFSLRYTLSESFYTILGYDLLLVINKGNTVMKHGNNSILKLGLGLTL